MSLIVNEKMKEKLALCEEYIWQLCCMVNMADGGAPALYGLEQHRIELHNRLCDLFGIDHIKSKECLSYLDDKIGVDLSTLPSDDYLEIYGRHLCNYLHEHIDEFK